MDNRQRIRIGAVGAFVAALLLVIQFVIGSTLGPDFAYLEMGSDSARVAEFLKTHAATLTNLMIVDDLFVVAYTVAFVGMMIYTRKQLGGVALLALGFALLTSATDFTENSLTIALTRSAAGGGILETGALLLLQVLSQLKYLWIYVAVVLYAVGTWQARLLNRVVTILFLLFPLLGMPALASPLFGLIRVVWMLVLLLAAGVLLWRETRSVVAAM
jgi:hypothetical protein